MSLTVELSQEALARLEAAANARGVSVEELAAEALSHVPAIDGPTTGRTRTELRKLA